MDIVNLFNTLIIFIICSSSWEATELKEYYKQKRWHSRG